MGTPPLLVVRWRRQGFVQCLSGFICWVAQRSCPAEGSLNKVGIVLFEAEAGWQKKNCRTSSSGGRLTQETATGHKAKLNFDFIKPHVADNYLVVECKQCSSSSTHNNRPWMTLIH